MNIKVLKLYLKYQCFSLSLLLAASSLIMLDFVLTILPDRELTFMLWVDNIETRQGHYHIMDGVIMNIFFLNIGGRGYKLTNE